MTDPGWFADPSGRHEHRYWDGAQWTQNVADAGNQTVDHGIPEPPTAAVELAPSAQATRNPIDVVLDAKLRNKLLVRKEIRRLPSLLEPGEQLLNAASGIYDGRNGLITVTDRRILFVDDGMMRKRVEEFHYGRVSSIQWQTGLAFAEITIVTSGNRANLRRVVPKERAQEIAAYVSKRISGDIQRPAPEPPTPEPPQGPPGRAGDEADPISQIRQLAELRDAGALSVEEFEKKKTELLGRL